MDQKIRDKWLAKKKWGVREAIWLMLDIDPECENVANFKKREFSSIDFSLENVDPENVSDEKREFMKKIPQNERGAFECYDKIDILIQERIYRDTGRSELSLELLGEYRLDGYTYRNPYKEKGPHGSVFPKEAYKKFAIEKVFSIETGFAADVPIFNLYHKDDDKRSKTKLKSNNVDQSDDFIEDVPNSFIKSLLDKNQKEYLPRLEALIRALYEREREEEKDVGKDKNKLDNAIYRHLKNLKIGNSSEEGTIYGTDIDIKALGRMAMRENLTKGGRPAKTTKT